MAPANTGKDRRSKMAVSRTDQTNRGMLSNERVVCRMLKIVEMKLMAPKIEETPARCNLKMVRSTEIPPWYSPLDKGG